MKKVGSWQFFGYIGTVVLTAEILKHRTNQSTEILLDSFLGIDY